MKFRRRHIVSGFVGLLTSIAAIGKSEATSTSSSNEIKVGTVEELFRSIGSNRTLKLTAPKYNLSELRSDLQWTNAFIRTPEQELVISGVENLKIESADNKLPLIVTESIYAPVLTFEKCRNITLSKLEFGHWPKKGACSGCVLKFSDLENIEIINSVLFGCGSFGIMAYNSRNISINYSEIKECTYGISYLEGVRDFTAENCRFYNNTAFFAFMSVTKSPGLIAFKSCEFFSNTADRQLTESPDQFFYIENSEPILLENCSVRDNIAKKISNNSSLIRLTSNKIENNSFQP